MARRKLDKGTRVIVATAAVVLGLAVGIVVVAVLGGGGGGGSAAYQPFFAGQSDRITKLIKAGGPVFYPGPPHGGRGLFPHPDRDPILAPPLGAPRGAGPPAPPRVEGWAPGGGAHPRLFAVVFGLAPPRPVADLEAGPLDLVTLRLGHGPIVAQRR